MFKKIPGTRDILPDEVQQWQFLEETARRIFACYNYREIRPPMLEDVSLFNRSLGDTTEIVRKQMFLIHNNEDTYALRPEGTASVVRAYVENNLDKIQKFVKFYYLGPMFRLERPQKGRLRQFHHIGCEVIGSADPAVDVEIISLADTLLKNFGISGYVLKLNSLGCPADKKAFVESLRKNLAGRAGELCEDCTVRFQQNVLRILDCKQEGCKKIVQSLSLEKTCLCKDCTDHFERVRQGLDTLKVPYTLTPHLVRGLDYYTRTVFEISHGELGAQDAIGAGGRYDTLVKELGGPDTGAMGFAFGVERLLLAGNKAPAAGAARIVYLIPLGEEAKKESISLLQELRNRGIACDTDYEGKSLKGAMRSAHDSGAHHVIIIGDNELKKNTVTIKDMSSGEQNEVSRAGLIEYLLKTIVKNNG